MVKQSRSICKWILTIFHIYMYFCILPLLKIGYVCVNQHHTSTYLEFTWRCPLKREGRKKQDMSDLVVHLPACKDSDPLTCLPFKFASALLHSRSDCLESGEECVTLALKGAPEGAEQRPSCLWQMCSVTVNVVLKSTVYQHFQLSGDLISYPWKSQWPVAPLVSLCSSFKPNSLCRSAGTVDNGFAKNTP